MLSIFFTCKGRDILANLECKKQLVYFRITVLNVSSIQAQQVKESLWTISGSDPDTSRGAMIQDTELLIWQGQNGVES
ncbi:hypothetical protein HR13_03270 [Porphyromonas gulae]|nr:hypothetical protein HR13_03270 [Porphyromonas gulae]